MKLLGIDHVVIVTPSLADSRDEFEALGFTVAPRARHANFGTANHLCVLQDTYIELLGLDPDAPPDAVPLAPFTRSLQAGGGLAMIALASGDAHALAAALRAEGLRTEVPQTWSRPADTPRGRTTATFTTFVIDGDPFPCFTLFCCQQHTRHAVWCDEWTTHPNGAGRLLGVRRETTASAGDVASAYARLVGARNVDTRGARVSVALGGHVLDFATGAGAEHGVLRIAATPGARTPPAPIALRSVPAVAIEFVAVPA